MSLEGSNDGERRLGALAKLAQRGQPERKRHVAIDQGGIKNQNRVRAIQGGRMVGQMNR